MTATVSTYLNSIPPGSPEYPLAQSILSKIALAASTTNAAHANGAKSELPSLFGQLLDGLIANNRLTPATILALAAAATGSRNVPDVGILGNISISGGTVTITPGAY